MTSSEPWPEGYDRPAVPRPADRPSSDFEFFRVSEGFCPVVHHGRLGSVPELPGAGWCESCWVGWAHEDRGVTLYLRPKAPAR